MAVVCGILKMVLYLRKQVGCLPFLVKRRIASFCLILSCQKFDSVNVTSRWLPLPYPPVVKNPAANSRSVR